MATDEAGITGGALQEIGSSGLSRWQGIITEGTEYKFRGRAWRDTLTQMGDTDPVIGAIHTAITLLIRQTPRRVEPGVGEEAEEDATFVEENFRDMSQGFGDILNELLTMLLYGWSWLELCYKLREGADGQHRSRHDDGKIGWRKWAPRAQSTLHEWRFDEAGGVQALVQRVPPDYREVVIPIEKSLLFRTGSFKNSPEGRSIFTNAWRPWYFKRNLEQVEAIGVERDLAGLPILGVPLALMREEATEGEKDLLRQMKELVRNIKRDENEGVIYPLIYDDKGNQLLKLQLLTSGGQRQFDTDKIIARYDQRIAMVALADFILLGHEKVGSFALSATKSDLFTAALQTWLDSIAEVINTYAIPRLLRLNGRAPAEGPRLVWGKVKQVDLEALGTMIQKLSASGARLFPSRKLEDHLLEVMGLPVPDDDDRPDPEEEPAPPPVRSFPPPARPQPFDDDEDEDEDDGE